MSSQNNVLIFNFSILFDGVMNAGALRRLNSKQLPKEQRKKMEFLHKIGFDQNRFWFLV